MSPEKDAPVTGELGDELEALKRRSGRSYEALARRTGLSRSSLHRYCQGLTVPGTFGAVESVARACGANEQELDRLYRAWRRVAAPEVSVDAGAQSGDRADVPEPSGPAADGSAAHGMESVGAGAAEDGDGHEGAEDGTGAAPAGPRQAPDGLRTLRSLVASRASRAWHGGVWLRAAAMLIVLVVTSYAVTDSYDRARGTAGRSGDGQAAGGETSGGQPLLGPDWSVRPRPVPADFFGLTLNTDTGSMPGFRTGSVRMWDSETRWGSVERRPHEYDWSTVDRTVANAERRGLPVLFTLSGTPRWAGPPDAQRSGYRDSLASPPEDLGDWDRFVRKAAERYRGRVDSYELWDYPSHPLHYAGSIATLAEMVERGSRIIRRADPSALVACPSFGKLWTEEGRERLRRFARTGAYRSCDAAALKLPPRKADGPPEEIIELAEDVERLLYEEGVVDLPLWNTGTDRDVAVTGPLDARRARDYAVRFYLAGLYARDFEVRRMYFYAWGSTKVPLVVQPVGGRPTEAGRRMERLYDWMRGARISSCGKGRAMGLEAGAYTCRFLRDGARADVYWTTGKRVRTRPLADGVRRVRHMDGTKESTRAGARIGFGEEPVLVEYNAR